MRPLRARLALWRRIWLMATLGERPGLILGGAAALLVTSALGAWLGQQDNLDPVRKACLLGGTPIAAIAGLLWTTFCGGAARQNNPANACLVPGLNRAVRQCVALVWVLTMLALLPLVWGHPDGAAVYPQFALALTGFGLYRAGREDGFAVLVAIILFYLFGSAWPSLTMLLVHPLGVAAASLLAIGYAAWALPRAFPVGGERHWKMCRKQQLARAQNDMVDWDKARRVRGRPMRLHAWVFARDIRHGARQADMLLHGLGPGNHRYHVLAMLLVGAVLFLALRAAVTVMGIAVHEVRAVAGTLTAVGIVALLSMNWARFAFSMRSTPGEQAILRLAPSMPAPSALNRVLGGRILAIGLREWCAATALVLAMLWLWDGSVVTMRAAIILAVATLGSIGISLDDYAQRREMNDWQGAFLVLWILFLVMLGLVHGPDTVQWSMALAAQLATSVAYIALRWRRMQRGPVAFPAGRMG